jgi:hypothetical protein
VKLESGKGNRPMSYFLPLIHNGLDCLIFRQIIDGEWSRFGNIIPKFLRTIYYTINGSHPIDLI